MSTIDALLEFDPQPETLNWLERITDKDPWDYVIPVDALIRKGKNKGWWDKTGEIVLFGSENLQACFQGLKGVVTNPTIVGTAPVLIPKFGVACDGISSYINLGVNLKDVPLVSNTKHTLLTFITTDIVGAFQETGATGTAGNASIMVRASSGLSEGFWSCSPQNITTCKNAMGMRGGFRLDSTNGFMVIDSVTKPFASSAGTMPQGAWTVGKAHPGNNCSPNRVLMVLAGAFDAVDYDNFFADFTDFLKDIDIFEDVQIIPEDIGEPVYNANDINDIVPSTVRVFQQFNFPASNTVTGNNVCHPITDSIGRETGNGANSLWTPARGGGFWPLHWSMRKERHSNDKPNDCFPGITINGIGCRPAYTDWNKAIGATLTRAAYSAGHDARNYAPDPRGWGYLDYAEYWGLDANMVQAWSWFNTNKTSIFTLPRSGYLACYDYVILTEGRLADLNQFATRGFMMDLEHADSRSPELFVESMLQFGEISHTHGFLFGSIGHFVTPPQGPLNGFTHESAVELINNPNIDYIGIIAGYRAEDRTIPILDILDEQYELFRDSAGNIPIEKLLVSCTLGVGSDQTTLADCQLVADWMDALNIRNIHIRRLGANQNGPITRYPVQQTATYLPNLRKE